MNTQRRSCRYLFSALAFGLLLTSCSLTTDPTKSSSDFTSSTSPGSSKPSSEQKAQSFTRDNFSRLKEDMALGHGEYLASLATLLGVPESQQAEFFAFTKENFSSLVSSEQVTPDEMLDALKHELATHPQFSIVVAKN